MLNYRLLALDLDGTTLTKENEISKETYFWIRRAVDAGVTVVLATGRPLQTAGGFYEELGLHSPMVLLNGAEIRGNLDTSWKSYFLSQKDVQKLHHLARERDAWFCGFNKEGPTDIGKWTNQMFEHNWMKFSIRHQNLDVIKNIRETVKRWGTVEVTRSIPINMEISPKGVSKMTGIRTVCENLGIDMSQVMAVGDSLNDQCLIQSAGLGVAMGNADTEIKDAAKVLTDSNERDGVAKAIKRYLFNNGKKVVRKDFMEGVK